MWLPSSFLFKGMLNCHILIAMVMIGQILIGTHLIPESVGSPILYYSPDTLQSFLKTHSCRSVSSFAGLSSRIQLCLVKNIIPKGSDKNRFVVFPSLKITWYCEALCYLTICSIIQRYLLLEAITFSFYESQFKLKETGIISNRFWL